MVIMAILHFQHYPKEHYFTLCNKESGFFLRSEEKGFSEPFWAEHGPEMLDISITNKCNKECLTCYRNSSRFGKHMSFADYEGILKQASEIGVFQIALGGGNPNEHPDFVEILKATRCDYGIIPNYTTNGEGLTASILEGSASYCGAVAVSAYEPLSQFADAINMFRSLNIRTNVHFVLDSSSIETAISLLRDPPGFLEGVNAIIFLNYKPIGRGSSEKRLLKHSNLVKDFIELATTSKHSFKVGFDSCMVSALVNYSETNPVWFDACEAARFTMYISEDMHMYPCSFMADIVQGVKLENANMLDAWQKANVFLSTRHTLKEAKCDGCTMISSCYGGCPAFPSINLCEKYSHICQ